MFEKITPEQAGISSKSITKFIKKLQKRGAITHGVLFMKGDKIFTEAYWKPFDKDFHHRMYSQTKSFVGVAIGLLEEEGKLSLDDKIIDHFPEKLDGEAQHYHKTLTIRQMLTMSTAGGPSSWFVAEEADRTRLYFNEQRNLHPSGTLWAYDSPGSQVLCALVEKLAGKPMLDYMKEKLFNEMGTFQTAKILKTRNGDSWGDSAMICTLRDIASFGRVVMNYGTWNGKRLMNEQYLKDATSALVSNQANAHYSAYNYGYGYQIWRINKDAFAFVGMGDQLTICYPKKDVIFACNSDNQGVDYIRQLIFGELDDLIADEMQDSSLPEDKEAQNELNEVIDGLELYYIKGENDSPFRAELNNKEYVCNDNPMGITKFKFVFNDEKTGVFHYTNAQGDKQIPFGVNFNVFGKFPQLGYANQYGATPTTDGFTYKDAVSFAWRKDNELMLFVQIIDEYFGNMYARFFFKGDESYATFAKHAEAFLNEYNGTMIARKK